MYAIDNFFHWEAKYTQPFLYFAEKEFIFKTKQNYSKSVFLSQNYDMITFLVALWYVRHLTLVVCLICARNKDCPRVQHFNTMGLSHLPKI